MILLLAAHVALWTLTASTSLDPELGRTIAQPMNEVLVSAASIWELEIKRANDKLRFEGDLPAELEHAGFTVLPITAADAVAAARLPLHHRDPFDRILVAQGLRLDATIVSRDQAFDLYGVPRLPA